MIAAIYTELRSREIKLPKALRVLKKGYDDMQEIRCPKCGEVFQVDESCYDQIAQQVRDKEFEKELERRKKELDDKREQELKAGNAHSLR